MVQWDEPAGAVVDRIWHLISREALEGKPATGAARAVTARRRPPAAV